MYTEVSFPGIKTIEAVTATINHGITAGQIVVRMTPQAVGDIPLIGDLVLTYGGQAITFKDCLADSATYEFNDSGELISLVLRDFRWMWEFGYVTGTFNLKNQEDDEVRVIGDALPSPDDRVANSETTPEELAIYCLEAMGMKEEEYNVVRLPNKPRPTVAWEYANPAQELQNLCDELGCTIAIRPEKFVRIYKVGLGDVLPDNLPTESYGETINPQNLPKRLRMIPGPTRVQLDFELEPVGLDFDGEVKPIDELSYAPPGATGGFWQGDWRNRLLGQALDKYQKLALKTVYRWYRIKPYINLPFYFNEDLGEAKYAEQFLPLFPTQVDKHRVLGRETEKEPVVFGLHFDRFNATRQQLEDYFAWLTGGLIEERTIMTRSYTIDTNLGIVKFAEPICRLADANNPDQPAGDLEEKDNVILRPALLYLRIASVFRPLKTNTPFRATWNNNMTVDIDPTSPAPDRVVRRDDFFHALSVYGPPDDPVRSQTNSADFYSKVQYYLEEMKVEYDLETPATRTYAGLYDIQLDGAIRSVTWRFDETGATTTASRNDDRGSPITLPYTRRRRQEQLKRLVEMEKAGFKPWFEGASRPDDS
jgi:hypothetical protein